MSSKYRYSFKSSIVKRILKIVEKGKWFTRYEIMRKIDRSYGLTVGGLMFLVGEHKVMTKKVPNEKDTGRHKVLFMVV
jgi:hypothetical protein